MIGIIGAMHEEVVELTELLKNKSVIKEAGMDFYMGLLNDKEVVVVEGGIGKVNAAVCTTLLINKFNAEKVIFTGVAGGINPILNVGDIVISSDLIQHDVDVTAFGCKFGEIPRMKEYIFKADGTGIFVINSTGGNSERFRWKRIGRKVTITIEGFNPSIYEFDPKAETITEYSESFGTLIYNKE